MTQLERFQKTLKNTEFDAAIISSELNRRYLCDFDYTDGFLLISAEKAYLITDFRYIEAARATVKNFDIILPAVGALASLFELIAKEGFKTVAFEEASLSCATLEDWKSLMGGAKLVFGASSLLSAQRRVKLPYEIERMEEAQRITDAAFAHILPMLSENMTELDVAIELDFFMRKSGAEGNAFTTIAVSGPGSALPHGEPANVKLRRGFLTMDFGAKYNGYCSDMTRTVVIGRADDELKKIYNTVLCAQQAALDGIHGGMLCRNADELARSVIREAGYGKQFGHSLGHGVGMFVHETPNLSPKAADATLAPGHVVTVEPGIYLEGKYGCRIEDMIAIKEDGTIHNFTHSPKELVEI